MLFRSEQRRLAGAVRPDQAQDFALADRERDVAQSREPPVPFGEIPNLQQALITNWLYGLLPTLVG